MKSASNACDPLAPCRIRQKKYVGLLLPVLMLLTPALWAAAGDVVTAFGQGGRVLSLATNGTWVGSVVPSDRGRFFLVGTCGGHDPVTICVSKHLPNGSPDTSFGPYQAGVSPFYTPQRIVYVTSAQRDIQGRLLMLGECTVSLTETAFCLMRVNDNGEVDTSFGNDGTQTVRISAASTREAAERLSVLESGRIVATGLCHFASEVRSCQVMLESNGTPAESVWTSGRMIGPVLGLLNPDKTANGDIGESMAVAYSDGSFLIADGCGAVSNFSICVRKFRNDGTPETSLGANGAVNISLAEISISPWAVAIDASERTYFLGKCTGQSSAICLVRMNASGALDTSFGQVGVARFTNSALTLPGPLTITRDGKLLFAASCNIASSQYVCVVRLHDDGSTDNSFGTAGVARFNMPGMAAVVLGFVSEQFDGALVVAGTCYTTTSPSLASMCAVKLDAGLKAAATCSLDLDGDDTQSAMSDGLIVLRALLGLKGQAVTAGVASSAGLRTDWASIRAFLKRQCGANL